MHGPRLENADRGRADGQRCSQSKQRDKGAAQNEYAEKDRAGEGRGVYAQRIVSSPGKKDGLFWRDDRDPSPLGELAAQASVEG
jgi:hypothetical protein